MSEYRFGDRQSAETFAAEHGGTVEVKTEGATIQGVDDYRPYVVLVPTCSCSSIHAAPSIDCPVHTPVWDDDLNPANAAAQRIFEDWDR